MLRALSFIETMSLLNQSEQASYYNGGTDQSCLRCHACRRVAHRRDVRLNLPSIASGETLGHQTKYGLFLAIALAAAAE